MAIYKTRDLLLKLHEVIQDGYPYVNVYESDDPTEKYLGFEAVNDFELIDYENVESCGMPEDPSFERYTIGPDEMCCDLTFTYAELYALYHALNNALLNGKNDLNDKSMPRDLVDDLKSSMVEWRNLQAKFAKFNKSLQ